MPIKKKIVKKAKKPLVVNRKFLTRLADRIYNPADRTFLRLCDGKLQNGPDPTDETRPMHCGLGELYFAMTGKQPEETGVDEGDVVDLAVKLSPLNGLRAKLVEQEEEKFAKAADAIKKLDLPDDAKDTLVCALQDADREHTEDIDEDDRDDDEHYFREALDNIPGENDDGCGNSAAGGTNEWGDPIKVCTLTDFRKRSRRVANQLRAAAKLLPA